MPAVHFVADTFINGLDDSSKVFEQKHDGAVRVSIHADSESSLIYFSFEDHETKRHLGHFHVTDVEDGQSRYEGALIDCLTKDGEARVAVDCSAFNNASFDITLADGRHFYFQAIGNESAYKAVGFPMNAMIINFFEGLRYIENLDID